MHESFSIYSKIFNLQYKIYRSYDYKYIGHTTGANIKAKNHTIDG